MRKQLKMLLQEKEVLKKAINYCYDKKTRGRLFDKLEIVNYEIEQLKFKIKLMEVIEKNEVRN